MNMTKKSEAWLLFLGDIVIFIFSLWFSLWLRHFTVPSPETFSLHLRAFTLLFIAWILVFYIAGLYEKHTLVFKNRLPTLVLVAQVVNSFIAVLFFYLIPYFSIAPKTVLLIYIVVSFVLLVAWRVYLSQFFRSRRKDPALLIGDGREFDEVYEEVNKNSRYPFFFEEVVSQEGVKSGEFQKVILEAVEKRQVSLVVIDLENDGVKTNTPKLYDLLFSHVHFLDFYRLYEDIFDRIPVLHISYHWFLENVSSGRRSLYDMLKRAMDIAISLLLGILSLVAYPFVILAIKIDEGGAIFIRQERIGAGNKKVILYKFRSMHFDDGEDAVRAKKNGITRVGRFLRRSRIDELPQLWNVLRGDISLIGPRPELPSLVKEYEKSIPYYGIRHIIKPGLSGWAQVRHGEHPHQGIDIKETRKKLSYDLYYVKNRSLLLDLKIALHTIRTLLSRSGR